MRKLLLLTFALITLMVSSCKSQQKLAVTASGENPLTFSCNGSTVTAKLKGNATTGYTWGYKVKDETIAKYSSDEYKTISGVGNLQGQGGIHYFVFEGVKQGTTFVTFDYAQHWKKGEKAGIRRMMIMVDGDLNVTAAEVTIESRDK